MTEKLPWRCSIGDRRVLLVVLFMNFELFLVCSKLLKSFERFCNPKEKVNHLTNILNFSYWDW